MPTEIAFLTKGISFRLKNQKKVSAWLQKIAAAEARTIESLTYVFGSDPFVASLNKKYLKHNTYTDILTFDYGDRKGAIIGEIYISIPRIKENAKAFDQPFERELHRVMAHGLLHILGYGDKSSREVALMRRKEEACLSLWA